MPVETLSRSMYIGIQNREISVKFLRFSFKNWDQNLKNVFPLLNSFKPNAIVLPLSQL